MALYLRSLPGAQVDFSSPQVQRQIKDAEQLIQSSEWTLEGSLDSWLEAFETASGGDIAQATFYEDLDAFVKTPAGARYASDIVFNDPADVTAGLKSSRIEYNWIYLESALDKVSNTPGITDCKLSFVAHIHRPSQCAMSRAAATPSSQHLLSSVTLRYCTASSSVLSMNPSP